jgi:formyltetrahydrofolate synthetase
MNTEDLTMDSIISHEVQCLRSMSSTMNSHITSLSSINQSLDNQCDVILSIFQTYECLSDSDSKLQITNKEHVEKLNNTAETELRIIYDNLEEIEKYANFIIEKIYNFKNINIKDLNSCRQYLINEN